MPRPRNGSGLRQRVRFERRTETDDGAGNVRGAWAAIETAPDQALERACSLTPTRGGEAVQSARLAGTASWDLWLRNEAAIRSLTTADRVVDARGLLGTFNITFGPLDMDGDGRWLFMQLTSGVADG
jgi:head-tail adaptor